MFRGRRMPPPPRSNGPAQPSRAMVQQTAVREDKPITTLATRVVRGDGVVALEGTAVCWTMALDG